MKILITGANGFVGSYLARHYIEKGYRVELWGRVASSICGKDIKPIDLSDYKTVLGEIENYKPDVILHCAGSANVGLSITNPYKDLSDNYITTHNLLFSLKQLAMQKCRFIFFSSAAVYGNPSSLPVKESAPIQPLSPYALHKYSAEECCKFMIKNYGLDIRILRFFSIYGPGLKKQIFWDMYRKISTTGKLELLGTGEESRDYIFIEDVVQAIDLIVESVNLSEYIFNVASGEETTIKKVAKVFVDTLEMDPSIISFNGVVREGDPLNWRADVRRLSSLGFNPQITLENGIKKYCAWAKRQNESII